MLHADGLQNIYENKKGIPLQMLVETYGKNMYYKKVGYNFLSVSGVKPAAYNLKNQPVEQTKLGSIKFQKDNYKFILLLLCGKFNLSKWLTYGDDFDLTSSDLLSFIFPFDDINDADKAILNQYYKELISRMPNTIQFKLNAGINVGTFNTSALWDITDKSDAIFYKYLTDEPTTLQNLIESHLSKCVISNKSNLTSSSTMI